MAITQTPRIALAARAAISLAVGLFLTFSQSHGAELGLLALGIFGLSFATFLTLILVPVMYLLSEKSKIRFNKFKKSLSA